MKWRTSGKESRTEPHRHRPQLAAQTAMVLLSLSGLTARATSTVAMSARPAMAPGDWWWKTTASSIATIATFLWLKRRSSKIRSWPNAKSVSRYHCDLLEAVPWNQSKHSASRDWLPVLPTVDWFAGCRWRRFFDAVSLSCNNVAVHAVSLSDWRAG